MISAPGLEFWTNSGYAGWQSSFPVSLLWRLYEVPLGVTALWDLNPGSDVFFSLSCKVVVAWVWSMGETQLESAK
jgi:hypothetical protein